MDTVTYQTIDGDLSYFVVARIVLVDTDGREVHAFEAASRKVGPFQRGEFDGHGTGEVHHRTLGGAIGGGLSISVEAGLRGHVHDAATRGLQRGPPIHENQ